MLLEILRRNLGKGKGGFYVFHDHIVCGRVSSLPKYDGTSGLTELGEAEMRASVGFTVCDGFIHSTYIVYEFIPGSNLISIL